MKNWIRMGLFAPALALGVAACTVEQTEEGNMPEYDVQPADVDVNWDTTQVRTPSLDITPPGDTLRDTIR